MTITPEQDELPLFGGGQSKLEKAFWTFHGKHPEVYSKLVEFARKWRVNRRARRIGIATVYEAARYTLNIDRDDESVYKLANNHRAFYARLIMRSEQDLAGIFLLKQQLIPCSFGPDNNSLPPNEGNAA